MMRSNLPLPSSRSCSAIAASGPAATAVAGDAASGLAEAGALVTAVLLGLASAGLASAGLISVGLPSAADLAGSPGWAVSAEAAGLASCLASGLASPPTDCAAWLVAVVVSNAVGFCAELFAGAAVSCGLALAAGAS